MDNIFGIGLPEFILILVIAGMVMGPERIARTARSLGVLTARLQTISRSFFRQLNAELDAVDSDGQLKNTVEELNQLRRQVADLRNEVFTLASGTAAETKQAFREIRQEAGNSILPPGLGVTATTKPTPTASTPEHAEPVYRPPSLAVDSPPRESTGAVVNLPKRLDVAEDPDA